MLPPKQNKYLRVGINETKYMTQFIVRELRVLNHWTRRDDAPDITQQIVIKPLVEVLQGISQFAILKR